MSRPRKRARLEEPQPKYDVNPTNAEWRAMRCYGSFTIFDQDDKPHIFRIGDDIFVLPTLTDGRDPYSLSDRDLWIGRIESIRAQAAHNAWIRVQWYYHPEELQAAVPTFQAQHCSSRERILSTHFDIVPSISCNGKATVIKLDENDPTQILPPNSFFYRLTFSFRKKGRICQVSSFPSNCICRSPYSPDTHTMRWCPTCGKWFHKTCLEVDGSKGSNHSHTVDGSFELFLRGRKLGRKDYQVFVSGLRLLAGCPISKGQGNGVVGNLPYVCRAKEMLQRIRFEGNDFKVPGNWMDYLGLANDFEIEQGPWMRCPICSNII